MNHALPHATPAPISERDAAWFEELAGAVARGRAALVERPADSTTDAALSLVALVDAGLAGDSSECEKLVRRLLKSSRQLDADESATVLVALARSGHAIRTACGEVIHDAVNRLLDSQSRDGGWPAVGAGAQSEPSCEAATASVLEALGHFGFRVAQPPIGGAVKFLLARQEEDGAWPEAWQVLVGLRAVGFDVASLPARRAARRLKESQNEDGGWGEGTSTATRTAQALLGLLSAHEADGPEVRAGAEFLVGTQRATGGWSEEAFDYAPQPRTVYWPLTALGRYATASGVALPAEPARTLSEIRAERRPARATG